MKKAVLLALVLAGRAADRIPAFPGAEGAGMFATGGRGGAVYRVTNFNARGPGSLADAVRRPNRIVVFTISGTIDLTEPGKRKGAIVIAQPNITIAGQTAPGEGICIKGGALRIAAGNVIIRYLRVRRGFNTTGDMGDAIDIKGDFENVIVDHVSTSWATDENLTLTNANRVTAQWSIAAEGLDYFNPNQSPNRHSEGSLFGSNVPDGNMTVHHSIYAHNRLRNPRTTGGVLDFRNNVVYDWKELASHTGSGAMQLNLVNNFYRAGPSTGIEDADARSAIFTFMSAQAHRLYAAGNILDGDAAATSDNWHAVRYSRSGKAAQSDSAYHATAPLKTPLVTTQSAADAYEDVLADAGATLPARDAVDLRIVNDIRHGAGAVINYETDIPEPGRWQVYHSLPAPADRDGDGIPDYWERQFGLDPNSPSDAARDSDGDGYTNLEEYLNNTDPRGGSLPLVYVSASVSRAYRGDGHAGEFRIARTGNTAAPLEVHYTMGDQRSATIPAGKPWVTVPVPAAAAKQMVATLAPGEGYHIGCPIAALVIVEDGSAPQSVDLARIDAAGGVTAEVRREGERNMQEHKRAKVKKEK